MDAKDPRASIGTYPSGVVDRPLWKLQRDEIQNIRAYVLDLIRVEHDRDAVRALDTVLLFLALDRG